jgi:7,8-dihydroneopterin aldolase/epimerase/oxygenase
VGTVALGIAMDTKIDLNDRKMVLIIRDMVLPFSIGIREHEKHDKQRVRINVRLLAPCAVPPHDEETDDYISYSHFVSKIRDLAEQGHINYLESLAERIAQICLNDARIERVLVSVEKIDIYTDVAGVGVLIAKTRTSPTAGN